MSYSVRLAITSLEVLRAKSVPIMMSHSLGIDVITMVQNMGSSIFLPWALTFAHPSHRCAKWVRMSALSVCLIMQSALSAFRSPMSEGMLWISFSVGQASTAVSVGCIPPNGVLYV